MLLYTSCAISNPIGQIQSCNQQIYVIQHSSWISFMQPCNIIFIKGEFNGSRSRNWKKTLVMFKFFGKFQKMMKCSEFFKIFKFFLNVRNVQNFSENFELFQNVSKFRKIWYWWYLFWQIWSGIAEEVYNKVNITFYFIQYHFNCTLKNNIACGFASCNIIFHCAKNYIAVNKMQYYYIVSV